MKKLFALLFLLTSLSSASAEDSLEDVANEKVVRVTLDSAEELPEVIKQHIPGEVFERSKDGKIDVIISLPNDNVAMGIWQVVTGNDTGDDFGATHGSKLEVGKDFGGYYLQGTFETNLYTERATDWSKVNGVWTAGQFFTEENILKFVLDNQHKGNTFFWEAGVGAIELNNEELRGWLFASGQQKAFHKATNAWAPVNMPDGQGQRMGGFVEGTVGKVFSDNITMGGNVRVKTTGTVTGVLSSLQDTSSVSAKAVAEAYYQSNKHNFAYTANLGVESILHQTAGSPSTDLEFGIGLAGDTMGVKAAVRQTYWGARQNYVSYNLEKGKTYTLEFFKKFGGGRRDGEILFDKEDIWPKKNSLPT